MWTGIIQIEDSLQLQKEHIQHILRGELKYA